MRYVSPMSMPKATTLESSESVTVIDGGVAVAVQRGDRSRQIPARWLRLLASDSANVDPVSGQRAYESVALPSMIRVRSASFCEEQGGWEVRFEGETSPVLIEVDRLLGCEETEEIKGPERIPFSSADQAMRAVDYENLEAPAALRSFLGTLFRCGYARVRDVPANEKELARFAKRLGHIGGSSGLSTFSPHWSLVLLLNFLLFIRESLKVEQSLVLVIRRHGCNRKVCNVGLVLLTSALHVQEYAL